MSVNKNGEDLYLISLLFEPNESSEELNFSVMCKFIRNTLKASQAAMAKKLGTSLSGYQSWEYGKSEPVGKAAANLGVMYIQCLDIKKQSPRTTQAKLFIDSLLREHPFKLQKDQEDKTLSAA